jgi:hypothetical protein
MLLLAPFVAQSQQDADYNIDSAAQYSQFLVPNYEWIGKAINDKSSEYYYPTLLKRFAEADTSLTIEDIHCLYYGYVLQKDYNPYIRLEEEDQARDILNQDKVTKKDAEKALKLLDKAVEKAPMHLRLYMYRHYANSLVYGEESKQVHDDAFRYVALISAIAASGDGSDFETAFHVAVVAHSYNFMNYFGFEPTSQSLQSNEGQQFDVFPLEENEYDLEELYVNVTPCLAYLSKQFKSSENDEVVDFGPIDQFDIRVGRKLTIKLDKKRRGEYKFRVIKLEEYNDTVELNDTEKLFAEDGEPNTIVFYCVNGRWNDNRSIVLLVMKSYCKEMLAYDTFIRLEGSAEFQSTSNNGIFPGVLGTEIWNDPINAIRISHLRLMK